MIIKKKLKSLNKQISNEELPYIGFSFPIYVFIEKLYIKCHKENIDTLFFLSREGEFLKKIFDLYLRKKNEESIHTYYFMTSRISSFVASLRSITEEDFDSLLSSYPSISLKQFMINCGFNEEDIANISSDLGIDTLSVISNIKYSFELRQLLHNDLFQKTYERIRTKQRELFWDYVRSFNVNLSEKGFHFVDVGWKGTMQDNFQKIMGNEISIFGYYLGLYETTSFENPSCKEGILFADRPVFSKYYDIYLYDHSFWERILCANHGSVLSYKEDGSSIVPCTRYIKKEIENKKRIEPIQNKIEKYFAELYDISEECGGSLLYYEELFAIFHYEMMLRYTNKERDIQNYMLKRHVENFGLWCFGSETNIRVSLNDIVNNIRSFNHRRRSFLFTSYLNVLYGLRDKNICMYRFLCFFRKPFIYIYLMKQRKLK